LHTYTGAAAGVAAGAGEDTGADVIGADELLDENVESDAGKVEFDADEVEFDEPVGCVEYPPLPVFAFHISTRFFAQPMTQAHPVCDPPPPLPLPPLFDPELLFVEIFVLLPPPRPLDLLADPPLCVASSFDLTTVISSDVALTPFLSVTVSVSLSPTATMSLDAWYLVETCELLVWKVSQL
jgi:hypothetical protein